MCIRDSATRTICSTTTVVPIAVATISASTAAVTAATLAAPSVVTISIAASTTASSSIAIAASTTASASITVAASTTASAAITVAAPTLSDELGGDAALVLSGTYKAERLAAFTLLLCWEYSSDEHTVDCELRIDTDHVTDAGALIEELAIKVSLWLLGTGGAPGVAAVITFAG